MYITQKYALCMLKEKRTLHENQESPYLVLSMLIEMMLEGSIEITDKDKIVLNEREPGASYNKCLYTYIKEMSKKEVDINYVLKAICYSLSSKKIKKLIATLKDSMVEEGVVDTETKKGLLGEKEVLKVNDEAFESVIGEVKTELLENGNLTEDAILLASLLNATKFIKNIFNKYEKEKLNDRLKEIKDTPIAQKVKIAQKVISNMSALIAAMMITSVNHV